MKATDDTVSPGDAAARAREFIGDRFGDLDNAAGARTRAISIADIVADLGAGADIVAASLLYPFLEQKLCSYQQLVAVFGNDLAALTRSLAQHSKFGFPQDWNPEKRLPALQAERLRKMLLAIIADVRLVLVRLADQLCRMRELKKAPVAERRRAATETREIFAPLANRLGIWQLKWELEDLAFRYFEPDRYTAIAKSLKEKRKDRESFISSFIATLNDELGQAGITADVSGRPKHIYSIWRKMQAKGLEFENVFDVRALRILVDDVSDCYAALGIVHSLWRYVPGEFDDYVANPKNNGYQSLHTAVIGSDGRPVEIQIRTNAMHEHAELGVAAHWQYKEGGKHNPAFEEKIRWLRQLIEPESNDESDSDFVDRVRSEIFEDRVYVISPHGDVIDLPLGATPVDFAYHVHTEIGQHCRGARVDDRMVPLNYQLENGQRVEIITAKNAHPSRDWLIPQLGYLASGRARSKVRAWFRAQNKAQSRKQGRAMLERELQRLGVRDMPLPDLAKLLRCGNPDDLYLAVGRGDITLANVANAIQKNLTADSDMTPEQLVRAPRRKRKVRGSIDIDGVGDLMSHTARCCRPVPPEPVAGYITLGRGVSIHKNDCANLLRLRQTNRDRVIDVSWQEGSKDENTYPAAITIRAYDRTGLIRDISGVLADERVTVLEMSSMSDRSLGSADLHLLIAAHGLDELSRVMHRVSTLPNIVSVKRDT